jgi:YD repeat-containing protein
MNYNNHTLPLWLIVCLLAGLCGFAQPGEPWEATQQQVVRHRISGITRISYGSDSTELSRYESRFDRSGRQTAFTDWSGNHTVADDTLYNREGKPVRIRHLRDGRLHDTDTLVYEEEGYYKRINILAGGTLPVTYAHRPTGEVMFYTMGDSVRVNCTYGAMGRLTRVQAMRGNSSQYVFAYTYDAQGRATEILRSGSLNTRERITYNQVGLPTRINVLRQTADGAKQEYDIFSYTYY